MSGSFQVVYSDLEAASTAFETESSQFLAVNGDLGGATAADTGDAALTALVARVLDVGAFLAEDLRNATFAHAAKLGQCAQTYQASDTRCTALFSALTASS